MTEHVDILLATFDGEEFVEEQLESILEQTHQNFTIIIGDDASRDTTPDIITQYLKKGYGKLFFHQYLDNVGTTLNFSRLSDLATSDYIMLSDQDDIWLPSKIENTLKKMKELESKYGKHTPLLVHTDLSVVDDNLKMIHPSFWKFCGYYPENDSLSRVLTQNNVMGSTIMINRALLDIAFPIPKTALMHDHWLSLVATIFGKVGWVEQQTMCYRQHNANSIGAYQRCDIRQISSLFLDRRKVSNSEELLQAKIRQAKTIFDQYQNQLSPKTKEIIEKFINLTNTSLFEEIKTRFHYNFHRGGVYREAYDIIASFLRNATADKHKTKF
ncbi:MAG: glycosyltransferase family 2 protein [Chlamydiota bacterium]|nr:glycosyltransferase family 2 protein [Chlamydiota bacterium]